MDKNLKGQYVDPDFVMVRVCPSLTRRLARVPFPSTPSYDALETLLVSSAPSRATSSREVTKG